MSEKILIVNLGAFGDIINSTPIAKHYKSADSNNHIAWITRKKYCEVLKNNANIDEIITIDESRLANYSNPHLTTLITKSINAKFEDHKIIFSAPYMGPKYDGTPRSTLLDILKDESSGVENWLCDFVPNISLSEEQKAEANLFFEKVDKNNKSILIEYESYSAQSPFNFDYIKHLCSELDGKNYNLIFTGLREPVFYQKLTKDYNLNFYHYSGSFISNAELFNLSDVFIGVSSGITCLTSSDYCDINKTRIEICNGAHWSTMAWKHNEENKSICYNFVDFVRTVKEKLS
jgi:ADP-heptose:LPS heptosyltransferase